MLKYNISLLNTEPEQLAGISIGLKFNKSKYESSLRGYEV